MQPKTLAKAATINTLNAWRARGAQKIFCIGRNKTGTTSLAAALRDLGFVMGHQPTAEYLTDRYYFSGDFRPIIAYCKCGEAFQDVPFSYPETYRHLDVAYPGSKFILTVRNDSDEWYRSITRFHAKKFGLNGRVPTVEDLCAASYRRRGFMYNTVKVHGTPDDEPYNRNAMIAHYERHNEQVINYFARRQSQLLVLNIGEQAAYRKFVKFLGVSSHCNEFPWENQT